MHFTARKLITDFELHFVSVFLQDEKSSNLVKVNTTEAISSKEQEEQDVNIAKTEKSGMKLQQCNL